MSSAKQHAKRKNVAVAKGSDAGIDVALTRPSKHPRPEWMSDRSKLPRRPPSPRSS